jgi:signal transduction histidine kinase
VNPRLSPLEFSSESAQARILVAEDDSPSSAVLRSVLGRAGYEVRVASDGPTTLRILEEEGPPDVLLLDWMLPGVSGLEICHQVRQRWDPLTLPILMVTARADAESISAAFDAGASDYLAKPFLGAELRARIAAHLRNKRLVEDRARMEERMQERQKLSAMGLLVSGVAHDLNTPLSGISGFAQLLLRGESDEHKRQDLQHILAEVERCRHIAGELLSLARRHPPERRPVSVPTIVRRTLALRERFLHAGGISVRMDAAETLPEIVADGHQLQQVFLNLLLNAEQAVGSQGSRIDIRIAPGEGSGEDLGWLVVEFFNDGPPIPEEILPHIFEPFVTTKGEEEGTGLGLTICNRIVREHRGRIEVDSGTEGTRFRILLPTDGLDASPASV